MNQEAPQQKILSNGNIIIDIIGCNFLDLVNYNIMIMEDKKINNYMDHKHHQYILLII